ncbi:MAG: HAD-IIIA family hydrolase [Herminiimonas sp.]|nr:HAD-IIIA family hydrolase [Herminiimonas sp.]
MTRAVFLNKDGTLIPNGGYQRDPDLIDLPPFAARGLRILQGRGYALFVVATRSDGAHGVVGGHTLTNVEQRIDALLAREQIALGGYYYCAHGANGSAAPSTPACDCQRHDLIRRAADDHDIDLARSWMVGDILDDIESGRRAGCKTVLISTGNETEWGIAPLRLPHVITFNLYRAAEAILLADQPR